MLESEVYDCESDSKENGGDQNESCRSLQL